MEKLMMKIVDCNGMSLLTLLLHINYSCNDCEIFPKLQEVTTFTNKAPQIYNLWMRLDRQYHQLLQAFETNDCHAAVREVLIQIDPDYRQAVINGQDSDYGSPLHFATASGDLELVRTLLEFGADPNSRLDETGPLPRLRIECDELEHFKHFRPLNFAAMRGHGEIGKVLLENGAELDIYHQLLQAFKTNDCHDAVRDVLIQIDPDYRQAVINGQDPDYGSPLHYATASGDLKLVRTLLELGADPNSRLDETGPLPRLRIECDELEHFKHFRPLHFAAMRGHGEIVEVLLENGAELNVVSDSGWMPVGLAKKCCHEKMMKRLGVKTGGKVSSPP
ncbi:hypothetical protein quinque_006294 [Culex quinquefasciatus]